MADREHSTLREGLATGLVGGLVVAVWYLAVDLGSGNLLQTPSVLGQVFVGGDTMPTVQRVVPGAVAQYSLLHFAIFLLVGTALVALTHMATRNPALRMGVWIGLVVAFLFFLGFLLMLYSATDQRFPWWPALIGSILGFGSMALLLWRRHPGLRSTFDQAPLGDEVKPPPHPPQRFHR
jgi:hypothetical protein